MKEITAEHYNLAIYEYEQGMTLEELREVIKHYEDLQQFEVCQGVHLAVEVIRFNILYELALEQKIKTKKLKWKSTKK
jgi:hypothetical protein